MRPVREDEVPAFGSIWRWEREGPYDYIVVAVDGTYLVAVAIRRKSSGTTGTMRAPVLDKDMIWFSGGGGVLDGWYCVDEGPHA